MLQVALYEKIILAYLKGFQHFSVLCHDLLIVFAENKHEIFFVCLRVYEWNVSVNLSMYMYELIYMYINVYICVYVYTYM